MRLFLSETRKLLGNAKILLIIGLSVMVNMTLLVIPEFGDYSPFAYNSLWGSLCELPPSERGDFIAVRKAESGDSRWFTGSDENEFADSFYGEQELLRYVSEELAQAEGYADYLKKVDDSAENMKTMSFFSDENSFNYLNIIKTQEEFSGLSTADIVSDRSKGVLMAVRFGASDILVLLLILFFTVKLLTSEREQGYLPLIRACADGRSSLGLAKLSALMLSSLTAALAVYGSGIGAGAVLYGLGDLERGIQSVYGFFSCGDSISVGTFLIRFTAVKLLFAAAFSAAAFMFSALPVGSGTGFIFIFAFTAAEAAFYFLIPPTSVFAPLRQINLAAAADSASLIGKYLNVNVFGSPVKGAVITVAAAVIFAAACGFSGVMLFSGKAFEQKRSVKKGVLPGRSTGLALNEAYKSFIGGKAVFIILAAALITALLPQKIKPYYGSISDYMYYSYISEIQGEYTEEKAEYIRKELEAAYSDFSEQGSKKIEALENLSRHGEYLKETGGFFLKDKGYKMLTGDGSVRVYDRLAAAVKAFALILAAAYSYTSERRFGTLQLLHSSPNGRGRTFSRKLLTMAVCALLILLIFDGSRIFGVLNVWGTELFAAPSCSMEHLSSHSMPIVMYLILTEIERIIGMIIVSAATFFISARIGNYSAAVIFSSAVFVVPLVLAAVGFEFMDWFGANVLLIGNVIG